MKKLVGLRDALEDNFDALQKPPRLFVKLLSFDRQTEIMTEVKHNSIVAKYFADQSRTSSPNLSEILDELSSKAESENGDSGDSQRSMSDSSQCGYSSSNMGQLSDDSYSSRLSCVKERLVPSGCNPDYPTSLHSQHSYSYENNAYGQSQENYSHLHNGGIESDLYEMSYSNVAAAAPASGYSYYHHQHGMSYPSLMGYAQYYPMWLVPPHAANGSVHHLSSGWPTPEASFHNDSLSQDQHTAVAMPQDEEEIENQLTVHAAQKQPPQTETEMNTIAPSDGSYNTFSREQFHAIPQHQYEIVVLANSGRNNDSSSLPLEELIPSEDKESDEDAIVTRDFAGSLQQRSWNRVPATRSRLLSGGSGSQLDIIEENISGEQKDDSQTEETLSGAEQDGDSELTLTVSSDASDIEQYQNGIMDKVEIPESSLSGGGYLLDSHGMSESSSATTSAQLTQRASLSSSSRTCLLAVNDEHNIQATHMGPISHQSVEKVVRLEENAAGCLTVMQSQVVNDTALTNSQPEIHKSTDVNVFSKLHEREQCLLCDKAEIEQKLEKMFVNAEESKAKLWKELEDFKAATQAEQDALTQTMADLENEHKQLTRQLQEDTAAWEEKLQNLNTSHYDEILLELNQEDERLKSEVEDLTQRRKEIDDLRSSIQTREEALLSLPLQVAQMEAVVDKLAKAFPKKRSETEKEISRQKALIARRELKPSHKLLRLQEDIMRIKQELEEVNCDCNEKRQIFTRLQSDADELKKENERLEGQVRSLLSQLPVVLSQLEQYEKRYNKKHGENNSRYIIHRLVKHHPSVTPTLASGSLVFDVTQLDQSFNHTVPHSNMAKPRRMSSFLS